MIYIAGTGSDSVAGGIWSFDDGLGPVGDPMPVPDLLYLIADPSGRFVYGVSGVAAGFAHAWRVSGTELIPAGLPVPTGGAEPCHLALDRSGTHLLVANYGGATGGSVAVLDVLDDGSLRPVTVLARLTAPGPQPDRQSESHIHQIVVGAGGEVLVVDLGADEVLSYRLIDGVLTDPVVSRAPAGSGPRHLVLLPDGVAISGELDSNLLRAQRQHRRFVHWQRTPSTGLPIRTRDRNYPSDLRLSADGKTLVLANRGADSVSLLSPEDGELLDEIPCGAWPRQLAQAGDRLLICSTEADEVGVLDLPTRRMQRPLAVPAPMCALVLPR